MVLSGRRMGWLGWLPVLVLSLASCGHGSAPQASLAPVERVALEAPPAQEASFGSQEAVGSYRLPTASERILLDELVAETERIRHLRFKEPVEVRIQDRIAMRAYVSRAIEQEDLSRIRRRYVALGLLDPKLDVRELLETLMEEELVGYYDPKERLLAVRDDVARSLGERPKGAELEWRATVVHELVHALQDQHLGLGAAIGLTRSTDADNAFGALVEGDATLAMLGYAAGKLGVSLQEVVRDRRHLEASLGASPDRVTGALKMAPAIVREPLLFRYRAGALFSAHLFHRGGWEAVDRAHLHPPLDTLSVLDPQHYRPQRDAHEFTLPPLDWLLGRGYRVVDQDVLGGFEMGVALEAQPAQTALVSRAWRGDLFTVLEHAEGDASVWGIRFASGRASREAERLFLRMPDAEGAVRRVLRVGHVILVVRNLPPTETQVLFERFRLWVQARKG